MPRGGAVAGIRAVLRVALRYVTKRQRELQRSWLREARRILRQAERAEARGYTVNYSKLNLHQPDFLNQRMVDRLAKIRGDEFYKYTVYSTEDGRVVRGVEGRKMERSAASKRSAATRKARKQAARAQAAQGPGEPTSHPEKGAQYPETYEAPKASAEGAPSWSKVVLSNFYADLYSVGKASVQQYLAEMVQMWVDQFGEDEAARVLSEAMENGEIDFEVKYEPEKARDFVVRWTQDLVDKNMVSDDMAEAIFNAIEDEYDWRDWDNGDSFAERYGEGY